MNADKLQRLNSIIKEVVVDIEGDNKMFTDKTRDWMVEVLADSIIRRTAKFCAGQREHGGDFLEKRLKIVHEIQQESDDSFWYFEKLKYEVQQMSARLQSTSKCEVKL